MPMSGMGGGMRRQRDGMQDIIIDRLLDDSGNGGQSAYMPSGSSNPAHRASSEPWLDALLDTTGQQRNEWRYDPPAVTQANTSGRHPAGRLARHGSVSQGSTLDMPQTARGCLHRSMAAGNGMDGSAMAMPMQVPQQVPSSVTGLLDADGLRAAAGGMGHTLRRHNGSSGVQGTSGIGFDDLLRDDLLRAAGVTRDDGVSSEVVDDVMDDDYTLPGTPAGAGVVRAKVRPTHVLGEYDMMGGMWDEILQGLVVFCVSILPLALMTIMAQNVIGRLCTSPSCVAFPISAVALSLAGARFTKVLHCDLWDRLTTPDALPSGRNGR